MDDKVRENIDYISKKHVFRISHSVDENTAFATFKELKKGHCLEKVGQIYFSLENGEPPAYLAEFTDTKDVRIYHSPQCKDISWASGFAELKTLHICESQVDDLSWLKSMHKLKWLEISDSPISDLSILRDHSDIQMLHLAGINISDIGFIKNYRNLTGLTLFDCPVEDCSLLYSLPSCLCFLEIDKKTAKKLDLEKLREKHIGIDIRGDNEVYDWEWLYNLL